MDKKSALIIIGILSVALVFFVIISFQKSTMDTAQTEEDIASTTEWLNAPAELPKEVLVTPKTVVTAKHIYRNGEHVIAGELPLPSPCHILEASGIAIDKKQVLVTLTSSVKTGELCAQVITPARFKVSVKADKSAVISATVNTQPVTLNLIEAGPNEDLDNFELYIKG